MKSKPLNQIVTTVECKFNSKTIDGRCLTIMLVETPIKLGRTSENAKEKNLFQKLKNIKF